MTPPVPYRVTRYQSPTSLKQMMLHSRLRCDGLGFDNLSGVSLKLSYKWYILDGEQLCQNA